MKRINRNFNTWYKKKTEEHPPDNTHLSTVRDRGTIKAEAITGLVIVKDVKGAERIVRDNNMPVRPDRVR